MVKHKKNFKMLKTLTNRFIPKYMGPYKVIGKPYLDVYTLQLPTMLVAHLTFHVGSQFMRTRKKRI